MLVPGACAMVNALIASGLDTNQFAFYGFLPLNNKNRKEQIDELIKEKKTAILYEAPHRIIDTLKEMDKNLENRKVVVAHELTKIHESFYRETPAEVLEKIGNPKGEYVILIEGNKQEEENELLNLSLEEHYKHYENQGFEKKEIIKKIAKDRGVNKNTIYQHFIEE